MLLSLAAFTANTALAAPNCPPLGPVFEIPLNFNSSIIRAAIANVTETLTARDLDNGPGVRANETSYSIEVFSISEQNPLIFDWHHTAPALARTNTTGVKKVDGNTVYRLGSLTKVHTVYAWLALDGDEKWNEPITKYVPELAAAAKRAKDDPVRHVAWDEVTIGSLAAQLSGAIRDCKVPQCSSDLDTDLNRWHPRGNHTAVQPKHPGWYRLPSSQLVRPNSQPMRCLATLQQNS